MQRVRAVIRVFELILARLVCFPPGIIDFDIDVHDVIRCLTNAPGASLSRWRQTSLDRSHLLNLLSRQTNLDATLELVIASVVYRIGKDGHVLVNVTRALPVALLEDFGHAIATLFHRRPGLRRRCRGCGQAVGMPEVAARIAFDEISLLADS